ncbi:hypothetical protein K9M78_07925 [Candidatus Bipolaricaulota bacterium]|nr:hypothetical protein [Candidatus Bipolaricaulota bacterium]
MQIHGSFKMIFIVLFGVVFTLGATGFTGLSQDATYSDTMSLCDYTIPETTYQSLGLDFNYHYYDDPSLGDEGNINRGSAFGEYNYIYSNPDYSINLDSNASLSVSRDELTYAATGGARYNAYLTETALFGFGGFRMNASSSFAENFGLRISTGSGFGRFKNVTPLVKAVLIRDMLARRRGPFTDIPNQLVSEMAQIIGRIGPEKSLDDAVSEITELVESHEELDVDNLDAVEVLRTREIIQEGTDQRLCGWEVRAGLGYEVIDPEGGARDFLVNSAARYARPFTTNSQLTMGIDFTSPFELTETYTINGLVSYNYRFLRNVDTKFQYSLLYQQGTTLYYNHSFSTTAEIQIRRDLSTSIALNLNDNSDYEEMTKEITVGLSFSLL